ncbi:hypothetical protein G7009_05545 [Pseudomonas capeferrum]|uniref:hypothetical protein n=1 Tax=Pseudomonas capeferrum TaxID=1495066 RepID=UPI0015E46AAC|nr:hypothetical protein [Pseudomonas capeferrum]MBA1201238.1 hypothetical protein [Pseudomonas capeferrum]
MNLILAVVGLGLALCIPAQAASRDTTNTTPQAAASQSNPYNSPIPRANPNSRQGSIPATPPVRGATTQPIPPPPTLDNRGIGNGENLRRQQQAPRLEPSRPPRDTQRVP